MERAGQKLKRVRERLNLTYREVEEFSRRIANEFGNPEFTIALSRLADIENKGAVPTIYRLYSMCAIYRLDLGEVLKWYGAPIEEMMAVALRTGLAGTHPFQIRTSLAKVTGPALAELDIDLGKTAFLGHLKGLGSVPLRFLESAEPRRYRYGLIGLADRSMCPILHPGSLVILDDQARLAPADWTSEVDRPIYFFEHREGYLCGWCDLAGDRLIVLPHPSSHQKPAVFRYPAEIDLVGQVVGVAAIWESARRSAPRNSGK